MYLFPRLVTGALAAALVLAPVASVRGEEKASGKSEVKEAGRGVGHALRKTTKAIGHATRDTVKAVGHGTRDAVKGVGEGVKEGDKGSGKGGEPAKD